MIISAIFDHFILADMNKNNQKGHSYPLESLFSREIFVPCSKGKYEFEYCDVYCMCCQEFIQATLMSVR